MHTKNQRNNICIIGSHKRNYTDIAMIKHAKKYFDSVFFIPITAIRLEMVDNKLVPKYRNEKIENFGTIIVKVSQKYYNLASNILDTVPDSIKIQNSSSFKILSNKVLMFKELASAGIKIPKICFITDPKSSEYALKELKFPILIQNPHEKEKRTIANSAREAKDIIETFESLKQPIILEETQKDAKIIKVYVVGNRIIRAISDSHTVNVSKNIRKTVFQTCKILNTHYAKIELIGKNVIDVDISPLLKDADIIDKKLIDNIMKRIEHVSRLEKGGIVVKIIDDFLNLKLKK